MIGALKKIDRKYLILFGCLIFLPLMILVVLFVIQGCSNQKITHEKYVEKMNEAAQNYISDNKKLKLSEGEVLTLSLNELVEDEYIKEPSELLDDDSCKGTVTIRKNGSTIEENEGGFLNYIVDLECDDYSTKSLNDYLMKDLTSDGDGLYAQGEYYVFKGEEVDNYIEFYGTLYRILSIDSEGMLKLLKVESEPLNKYWDNKYNTEVNNSYGKNIYEDSSILKSLRDGYLDAKKMPKSAKKHVVSYDVCVDARDVNDLSMTSNTCANVLKNQVVSLIGVTDFANASLDPECVGINSKSCRNYNYLKNLHLNTWTLTAVSNNTYEVYYLHNGIVNHQEASKYLYYNWVIYIDGNDNIVSGDGSESNPYVMK